MYLCKIRNTKDMATAFLLTPYKYARGDIIYPHPDHHPQLAGHEINRWRVQVCIEEGRALKAFENTGVTWDISKEELK